MSRKILLIIVDGLEMIPKKREHHDHPQNS